MSLVKKNKIVLSDYPYMRDVEIRLLMANLSSIEHKVLCEIVDGSLTSTADQIATALELPVETILPILHKFNKTSFFQIHPNNTITVDKTLRRSFELKLQKFDDNFEPGMEFLQNILTKVPISALPNWYCIPRTTDNIFASIVEKFMQTPKLYERYLAELSFEDPLLHTIIRDVFSSPNYMVESSVLMQRYNIPHVKMEELLLFLEFNLVCCLSYKKTGDKWIEIVTPFAEWRNHLLFIKETMPTPILAEEVKAWHKSEFGYIQDLNVMLKMILNKPLSVQKVKKNWRLSPKDMQSFLQAIQSDQMEQRFLNCLIEKQQILGLSELIDGTLTATENAKEWLSLSIEQQALAMYKLPLLCLATDNFCDRDVRESEKSLKRVMHLDWIYFDDFMKGMLLSPIGTSEQVLVKKGKRWRYAPPEYTADEKAVISSSILERLVAIGMVAYGTHNGKQYFRVTPFGRSTLE